MLKRVRTTEIPPYNLKTKYIFPLTDGNQYVTIPLSSTAANLIKSNKLTASGSGTSVSVPGTPVKSDPSAEKPLTIKQEYD